MRMQRLVIAMLFVLLGTMGVSAQEMPLPTIIPTPQEMTWKYDEPRTVDLGEITGFYKFDVVAALSGGIDQVNARLRSLALAPFPVVDNGNVTLRLVKSSDRREGYLLDISTTGIVISGTDLSGLYYGLVTLSRLIGKEGRIPCVVVKDWPDMNLRGTYIAGYEDIERRIMEFAALKYNLVLFEDSELYLLDNPVIRKRWQDIFSMCRKHFIDPVPELQSLGWGQHVLRIDSRTVEGVLIENLPLKALGGAIVAPEPPVARPITIANPGFEQNEGNLATGWQQEKPGEYTTVVQDGAQSGKGCLRITILEEGTARCWQDLPCEPNHWYELSYGLKTENVKTGMAYAEVYALKGRADEVKTIPVPKELGVFFGRGPDLAGTKDWTPLLMRFGSGDNHGVRVYLRLQEGTGTAWFDNISLRGIKPPHPLDNVIVTEAAPFTLKSENGKTVYEAGKDYKLAGQNPPYPFGIGATLSIEVLSGSRIQEGACVLASFHQAPIESITCCPSEPHYQEVMHRAINHVVTYLKPNYIHIGHDEPRVINRDGRCKGRGLTDAEVFADDVKRMHAYAKEADPNVRLMMWNDALDPYHGDSGYRHLVDAAKELPRDIVINVWWYDWPDVVGHLDKSTKHFLDLGFEVTGSPWFRRKNAYDWTQTLYKYGKNDPKVLGSLYTSWAHPSEDPWGALDVTAEYSWTAEKPPFEE